MHRFFLPVVCSGAGEFPLSPGDANKVCRVLRLRPGTEILLWDEAGKEYRARITRIAGRLVFVQVVGPGRAAGSHRCRLSWYRAFPRAIRWIW